MSGIEPADRARTDTTKHSAVLIGRYQKSVDAETPPEAHHHERISASDVNDICRRDLPPDLLLRRSLLDQEEDVGSAFQEFAEVLLDVLPIYFGVRACGWHKKKPRILLVRESDNLSINRSGAPCSYVPAADGNNRRCHAFILARLQ